MPPFAVSKKKHNKQSKTNQDNYEVSILVMAKKVGLSFQELSNFTLQDFIDFIDIWLGEEEGEVSRKAEQEDIDNFYKFM